MSEAVERLVPGRGRRWLAPLVWAALLLAACVGMPLLEGLFRLVEPDSRSVVYARADFLTLLGRHLLVVAVAALAAVAIGVGAAVAVTRRAGRDFLPLVAQLASIGQTFPPVAVLALAVPVLGFPADHRRPAALRAAADRAQYPGRARGHRSRCARGGAWHGHDRRPAAAPGGTAAGLAGDTGRHPHLGDHQHRHRGDRRHRGREQPGRSDHLRSTAIPPTCCRGRF